MKDTEDIHKKEKKLRRDHWMCRVQKYTFGIDAPTFYMGYCPFFWMTWVSLAVLPIVFICKSLYRMISTLISPIIKYAKDLKDKHKERLSSVPLEPPYYRFLHIYEMFGEEDTCLTSYGLVTIEDCMWFAFHSHDMHRAERIRLWFIQNPNWRQTHLEPARAKHKAEMEMITLITRSFESSSKNVTLSSRKLVSIVSVCGKGLFKLLIPVIIIGIATLVYFGLARMCMILTLSDVVGLLTAVCAGIAIFLMRVVLLDFITTFSFTNIVYRIFKRIIGKDGVIHNFFKAIHVVWVFLKDTVALTYKAECPLIVWGDETEKITHREKRNNVQSK